jgi:hypothetical protein
MRPVHRLAHQAERPDGGVEWACPPVRALPGVLPHAQVVVLHGAPDSVHVPGPGFPPMPASLPGLSEFDQHTSCAAMRWPGRQAPVGAGRRLRRPGSQRQRRKPPKGAPEVAGALHIQQDGIHLLMGCRSWLPCPGPAAVRAGPRGGGAIRMEHPTGTRRSASRNRVGPPSDAGRLGTGWGGEHGSQDRRDLADQLADGPARNGLPDLAQQMGQLSYQTFSLESVEAHQRTCQQHEREEPLRVGVPPRCQAPIAAQPPQRPFRPSARKPCGSDPAPAG